MKLTNAEKMRIYRRNLAEYERDGNEEWARVTRALIKRLEAAE